MKLEKIISKIPRKARIAAVTTLVAGSLATGIGYLSNYEQKINGEVGPSFKVVEKNIPYGINDVWKAGVRNVYIVEPTSEEMEKIMGLTSIRETVIYPQVKRLLIYHIENVVYSPNTKIPKLVFKYETMHRHLFSRDYRTIGWGAYGLHLPQNFEIKDGSNFDATPSEVYWQFKNLFLF